MSKLTLDFVKVSDAWRALALSAGFPGKDHKAAAGLVALLGGAYLLALVLALSGPPDTESAGSASEPAEEVSLDALDRRYQDAKTKSLMSSARRLRVPSLFLTSFPDEFAKIRDADAYKRRFVQIVLPIVLAENRRVRRERASLVGLVARLRSGMVLRPSQQDYLERLTARYRTNQGDVEALRGKIDSVPTSLALAQAAVESSWGRSRFSREGNALFGQWTYNRDVGLLPLERPDDADHFVRRFPSLRASVRAYIANLNGHPAYAEFRERRKEMHSRGRPLSGYALAPTLRRYSERGVTYTETIQAVIKVNRLGLYDRARLGP